MTTRRCLHAGLALAVLIGQAVLADEPAAIPAPAAIPHEPDVQTWRDWSESARRFFLKHLPDAYDAHGLKNPDLDDDVRRFLADMAAHYAGTKDARPASDLLDVARGLIDRGSRDPLVYYCRGTLHAGLDQTADAKFWLLRSSVGFEKTPYSAYRLRQLANRMQRIYKTNGFVHQAACGSWQTRLASHIETSLTDGTFDESSARVAWWNLQSELAYDLDCGPGTDPLMERLRNNPRVDPWILAMLEGDRAVDAAWRARGGDYAYKVTDEGWKGFAENLQKARDFFEKAYAMRPGNPEAAAELIQVTMGQGDRSRDELRLWFDRSVAAQMDYDRAYSAYLWAIRPRWGGSHEEMMSFARECLNTGRFDTQVPWYYFRTLSAIDEELQGDTTFWRSPGVFLGVQKLFGGYMTPGNENNLPANATAYALAAWKAGQFDLALALMKEHESILKSETAREYFRVTLDEVRLDLALKAGPLAAAVRRVEDDVENKRYGEARRGWEELAAMGDEDPLVAAYAGRQVREMGLQEKLSTGEWVELGGDLDLWRVEGGDWTKLDDGSIRGTSRRNGLKLVHNATMPLPLEVSFELEYVRSNYSGKFNGGVYWLAPDWKVRDASSFCVYREERSARLREEPELKPLWFEDVPVESITQVDLLLTRKSAIVRVNGKEVAPDHKLLAPLSQGVRVGIGGDYWYADSQVVFRTIKVRKAPAKGSTGPVDAGGISESP